MVEKISSIYCKVGYTEKDVERNIFMNPFKRFEDMRFKEVGIILKLEVISCPLKDYIKTSKVK